MILNMSIHLFFLVKSVIRDLKMKYYKYRYKYIIWKRQKSRKT